MRCERTLGDEHGDDEKARSVMTGAGGAVCQS
jgi:hypothetical protein